MKLSEVKKIIREVLEDDDPLSGDEPPYEIVVLDDFDTWAMEGYIVELTPDEFERLQNGEKLKHIVQDEKRLRPIP